MAPEIDLDKQRPAQYIFVGGSAEDVCQKSAATRALAAQQKASTAAQAAQRAIEVDPGRDQRSAASSGLRATPRRTLRRSMSPFGLIAVFASRRQRAAGGIADDAQTPRSGMPASAA